MVTYYNTIDNPEIWIVNTNQMQDDVSTHFYVLNDAQVSSFSDKTELNFLLDLINKNWGQLRIWFLYAIFFLLITSPEIHYPTL